MREREGGSVRESGSERGRAGVKRDRESACVRERGSAGVRARERVCETEGERVCV